ncbi:serine/threonine protein kinase [Streptomyces sp. WAC 06738]|uniref:serine/threonine protein kinase n=1 Tax=Streptomyces sp. WAC 06738 TaxID=2203210 RepID=UPI000F6E28BE|nr:serine/threonine-protein kinase [Streptomyces sp. WAC 06738]AZM45028.1 serine/threonine protein kinase [Streptomyces sp. WAC 06738]
MAMMRLRREDPRVVGSFRIHRRLGAGGMGVVYLGSDRRGQRVALKVIRPDLAEDQEFRSRFAREVSAARRIRGGCTARLVAADLDADRPWFATQYVPGPSLHDKVGDEGPLIAARVAAIGAALSEGLVAVHEAGVVHRDLKPSNILLSPKGPRIIDFGIAWATGASTLTHVGTAVGSPGFLAPEQVRGQPVTPASDVFSLGATLAYATTGDSPFGQGSSEVMLYRVVHEEPLLDGVPDALAPLLRTCLAKTPDDRPSTLQLSLRLKEIAAREAHGAGPEAAPPRRTAAERAAPGPTAAHRPPSPRATGAGRPGPGTGAAQRPGPHGAGRAGAPQRPGSAQRPGAAQRPGQRAGGGAARKQSPAPAPERGRQGADRGRQADQRAQAPRSGPREGAASAPRKPAPQRRPAPDRARLMRQRLIVFVTVTLLVALGIAAAQGCQGPL